MTGLLQFAIVVLVQVSVICVAAGLLLAMFRKSAARRHGIAATALALLLLSPVLAGQLPSSWLGELLTTNANTPAPTEHRPARPAPPPTASPEVAALERRPDHSTPRIRTAAAPPRTTLGLASSEGREQGVPSTSQIETSTVEIPRRANTDWLPSLLVIAVWTWLGGIVIALVQLVRRLNHLKPIRQSLKPIETDRISTSVRTHVELQFAAASLPPVMVSHLLRAPVVLGLLRPVVVLPENLLRESNDRRLSDVLIHECAHIARGDHWIHAFQQLAGVLYWLHPGVRWLNHALATAREEVCDNYVLRQSDPTEYAQTLLELTEQCGTRQPVLSLLGLFSPRWSLESRVTGLLHPQRPRTLRSERMLVICVTILLCTCCLLTGGIADDTPETTGETEAPTTQEANPERRTAPEGEQSAGSETNEQKAQVTTPSDTKSADEFRSLRVHGYCEDDDGELIVGATVSVYRYPTPTAKPILLAQDQTNGDGEFDFPDIRCRSDLKLFRGISDLMITASADGHSSGSASPRRKSPEREIGFMLHRGSSTLSGTVTDPDGRPVSGATILMHPWFTHPIPGFESAVTDDNGRYSVPNLPPRSRGGTRGFYRISHPEFGMTRQMYSTVQQQVDVILELPGIVEGQVIDLVTGKPVPNVTVTAEGIARYSHFDTQTDSTGSYRLRMPSDHYNIWAEVKDRMPLAIKALKVTSTETKDGIDIRMSQGGFVTGRILNARGKPASLPTRTKTSIAHHGPARPQTGFAVTSVEVDEDGAFRLHVAPGRNYVYVTTGIGSAWIDVQEGQEVRHDFTVGTYADKKEFTSPNADQEFVNRLRSQAIKEDEARNRKAARHARWLAFPDEITQLDRALHKNRDESVQLERAMLRLETERLIAESPDVQRPHQDTASRGAGQVLQRWKSERLSRDFVQVSIGSDDRVTEDMVLTVSRQKKLICGIKVTHVTPDWSIGVVIDANRQGIPRKGDRVKQGPTIRWTTHR